MQLLPWLLQEARSVQGRENKSKLCLPIHKPSHGAVLYLGFNMKTTQDIYLRDSISGEKKINLEVEAASKFLFLHPSPFYIHCLFQVCSFISALPSCPTALISSSALRAFFSFPPAFKMIHTSTFLQCIALNYRAPF